MKLNQTIPLLEIFSLNCMYNLKLTIYLNHALMKIKKEVKTEINMETNLKVNSKIKII
jgi:hypothetical protein